MQLNPSQITHQKKQPQWQFWGSFLLINAIIATVIHFLLCPACASSWTIFADNFQWWVYGFALSATLGGGIGIIEKWLNQSFPWLKSAWRRLLVEIPLVGAYSFVASFVVIFLILWWFGYFSLDAIPWQDLLQRTWFPILIAYVLTFFFTTAAFLREWRQAAVDAEKLRTEKFAGQYRQLRDQLNPHFLFNSLNVLSNIVYDDQKTAVEFIQNLSRFYRYVLEVQDEEVVSLTRELEFAERYLYLQKLRFGENLSYSNKVEVLANESVPPLSIQLLLENALKHNEVSQEFPLHILMTKKDEKLHIENNINPKENEDENTGVGLKNISERYRLLANEKVEIERTESLFRVSLPILKMEKNPAL